MIGLKFFIFTDVEMELLKHWKEKTNNNIEDESNYSHYKSIIIIISIHVYIEYPLWVNNFSIKETMIPRNLC